jgi:hypothetical protein
LRSFMSKFSTVFLIMLLMISCFAVPAYGAGGGDGSGGGGGAAVPLWMDWCYPANGETNVSTTVVIQCKYSHNVAQSAVSQRNIKQFSLTKKSDGTPVEIDVYTADSQVEFDKRQYIYVRPVQPLENGTTYRLLAKEGVQAKNGMVTASDQSFEFTTCHAYGNFNDSDVASMINDSDNAAAVNPGGSQSNIGNVSSGNSEKDSLNSAVENNEDTAAAEVDAENHVKNYTDQNSMFWFILIAAVLLILSAIGKLWRLKRNAKQL